MKRFVLVTLLIFSALALLSTIAVFGKAPMSPWPFFIEVTPRAATPGVHELVVPLQVMDKSREDLADLRLYDANAKEIPYALRVRKEIDEKRAIASRMLNKATVGSVSEVSVDLGDNPGEHNEVEIETAGSNFRRRVEVEGSDSGKEWRTLKTGDVIFRFESQNKVVESKRVTYPRSTYKYLRVRVSPDELTDKQAPDITMVGATMTVREPGELTTWNVAVPSYQLLRSQGAPASAWTIDLGAKVPCDRLALTIDDQSFSRPFQVEDIDESQNMRLVASGELSRRIGEARQPLVINFDSEQYVRRLRLLSTDYNNQTLTISSINASAPARQLVFELKEPVAQPLRLFFGNLKATAPHYDFEKELPAKLAAAPVRAAVGAVMSNPDYKPEPLPLTERIPWLIYVVLGVSSLALALILLSLARTTLRTQPKPIDESNAQSGTG